MLTRSPVNFGIIRVACSIIIAYVRKKSTANNVELILKFSSSMRNFECSSSFIEMCGEICRLFIIFDVKSCHEITKNLSEDYNFMTVVFSIFQSNLFETVSKIHLANIIMFLLMLVRQDSAYNYFCDTLDQETSNGLQFISKALSKECDSQILRQNMIHFITFLLIKGQIENGKSNQFSDIIDKFKANFIFHNLKDLFCRSFHGKSFTFTQMPDSDSEIVCNALSVLLKTSKVAKKSAEEQTFLQKILQPIKVFFDKFGNLCSDFVRKYGEQKLKPIITNLTLLFGIISNWFSNHTFESEEDTLDLSMSLLKSWSWSGHDKKLRNVIVSAMMFLSDKSLKICQVLATITCSSIPHTILQLITKYVSNESLKATQSNLELIKKCLRILQNCCATSEGRSYIFKENVLQVFDRFQLIERKNNFPCWEVYKSWLVLWEVSSRYTDSTRYQNIQILEDLCENSNSELRTCSWKIIRNLSFKKDFRNVLINSNYFLKLARKTIENGSDQEQLLVCVIIWRLIANNSNARSKLKDHNVLKSIKNISKFKNSLQDGDLQKVISVIISIVDS